MMKKTYSSILCGLLLSSCVGLSVCAAADWDPDQAVAQYTQMIQQNPGQAVAYNNRGMAYKKKGQQDLALQDLSQAIALDPAYSDAYNTRMGTRSARL